MVTRAITLSLVERGSTIAAAAMSPCEHARTGAVLSGASRTTHKGFTKMNRSQQLALTASTSRHLTLVQGPPGTGKTATALQILAYWIRSGVHGSNPPLACSDSNIAVDNMLEGLVKLGINAVRIGRPENTRPELLRYSIDEIIKGYSDPQERHKAKTHLINAAHVVCCTCVGAGAGFLSKKQFAAVLVDEASQATETATIIPLTHGCRQFVCFPFLPFPLTHHMHKFCSCSPY